MHNDKLINGLFFRAAPERIARFAYQCYRSVVRTPGNRKRYRCLTNQRWRANAILPLISFSGKGSYPAGKTHHTNCRLVTFPTNWICCRELHSPLCPRRACIRKLRERASPRFTRSAHSIFSFLHAYTHSACSERERLSRVKFERYDMQCDREISR